MPEVEPDLLEIERGLIVAPAGCGKTELIARALRCHTAPKPILVLTHTNSGVAALRDRLDRAKVSGANYRIATIDGWAIRLISTFPMRSGHDPAIIEASRPNYRAIREAATNLLRAGHVNDVIAASYARLLVDEYQDCSTRQHAIIRQASAILPTCVVGDPIQAIFGFGDDPLANWETDVLSSFPLTAELEHPWRWTNAGADELGYWLLEVRRQLLAQQPIDLANAPSDVRWIQLDGSRNDYAKLLQAGRVKPPTAGGSVLIIGESTSPSSQQKYASQTPGAVTVEAVDLRDLVKFAQQLRIDSPRAVQMIAEFAESIMTNVGAADLVNRIDVITRGTSRKEPSDVERSALTFLGDRCHRNVLNFLVELNKQPGVHVFRPAVLRACIRALELCCGTDKIDFYDAAVRVREQGRLMGRSLQKRSVGSTLLLKGLEADVAVILDADSLNARNLYVAMTRGSRKLILCGRKSSLKPAW